MTSRQPATFGDNLRWVLTLWAASPSADRRVVLEVLISRLLQVGVTRLGPRRGGWRATGVRGWSREQVTYKRVTPNHRACVRPPALRQISGLEARGGTRELSPSVIVISSCD